MHDPRNARNAVIGPDTSACRWRWNSASAIPSVGYCIDAARVAGLRAGKDRNNDAMGNPVAAEVIQRMIQRASRWPVRAS